MSFHDRIIRDPAICGGQPVIKGKRVLVRVILGYLAQGDATTAILREFPTLEEAEVRAVIRLPPRQPARTCRRFACPARGESGMRLKLDENIPASGAVRLAALGHDVHTVRDEGLGGRPDDDVWHAAQAEDRFLVTQDLDFSTRVSLIQGS